MSDSSLDLVTILKLEGMAPDAQSAFLAECVDEIFSTSLLRFEPLLSGPDQEALDTVLQKDPEPDDLLKHLVDTYPEFLHVIQAVSEEYKSEFTSRSETAE